MQIGKNRFGNDLRNKRYAAALKNMASALTTEYREEHKNDFVAGTRHLHL